MKNIYFPCEMTSFPVAARRRTLSPESFSCPSAPGRPDFHRRGAPSCRGRGRDDDDDEHDDRFRLNEPPGPRNRAERINPRKVFTSFIRASRVFFFLSPLTVQRPPPFPRSHLSADDVATVVCVYMVFFIRLFISIISFGVCFFPPSHRESNIANQTNNFRIFTGIFVFVFTFDLFIIFHINIQRINK